MTKTLLDITGDIHNELGLPVPPKVKARLQAINDQALADARAKGEADPKLIVIPDEVVLILVEGNIEDRRRFGDREKILRAQNRPEDYLVELIMERATPGTDQRVVEQMVNVMVPSSVTKITHACIEGELPKAVGGKAS